MQPVAIRWVLLRDPAGKGEPAALLSTDLSRNEIAIVNAFIKRWTVEVTLKEVRTRMGLETQRQWSDRGIAKTMLMGLFSITALWADELYKKGELQLEKTAWYIKKCQLSPMPWLPFEGEFGSNILLYICTKQPDIQN